MSQTEPTPRPMGRHSVLEDASSAILALLLALVVWVVASYDKDPVRTDFYDPVLLKYLNLGDGLQTIGKVEDRVRVQVRAPASYWQKMTPGSFEATVDLKGLDEGTHNLEVDVRPSDKAAEIVARQPARVAIRLERSVRREVEVHAVVADADSIAPGYALVAPKAIPEKVTISGPRTAVDRVRDVVARVWLRGSKTTLETQVSPEVTSDQGEVVTGVELSPRTVTVRLGVEPLADFRDVTVKAVLKGAPAAGYWVSSIGIDPSTVTVQGKTEIIRTVPAVVSTAPIDITGVKESFSRRVAPVLPEGVSVYSAEAVTQTVLVRVEVTAIVGGKTVQPRVEMLGLRSGLSAAVSPDTVDVILSGPLPELQALQPDDVRVVVNLFNLAAGRRKVVPTVLLPERSALKVESIAPDSVEVVISATTRGSP